MTHTPLKNKKILIWATETEISILIDRKLYKKPVDKKQLLNLAQMFLDKAINKDYYEDFKYVSNDFTDN